jgi:hypothetical protein
MRGFGHASTIKISIKMIHFINFNKLNTNALVGLSLVARTIIHSEYTHLLCLIAYYICIVMTIGHILSDNSILISQSSEEVNDWNIQRRGDFEKKKKFERKYSSKRTPKHKNAVPKQQTNAKKPHKPSKPIKESQVGIADISSYFTEVTTESMWETAGTMWNNLRSLSLPEAVKLMELPSVDTLWSFISEARFCPLFTSFYNLLSVLMGLGYASFVPAWMPLSKIVPRKDVAKSPTIMDLLEAVMVLKRTFFLLTEKFFEEGDWRVFIRASAQDSFEQEYAFLCAHYAVLSAGRSHMDPHEYDRRLAELAIVLCEKLTSADEKAKLTLTQKLREVRSFQSRRTLDQRDTMRKAPFGVLLYGGSGVGKSSIVNIIVRTLLAHNNFDAGNNSVITLNEADKYQSEFRTHHNGVIFDDLCNTRSSKTTENPLNKVIQFNNNVPIAALNPVADMKGNVMIEPNVLCATTNVKHLDAWAYSNEPISICRRFHFTVTQTVKDKYKDERGMIDPDKLPLYGPNELPDYALFEVQVPIDDGKGGIGYHTITHKGKLLKDIGFRDLLVFLCGESEKHVAHQERMVKNHKEMKTLTKCEKCSMTSNLCACKKESQSFEAWITIPVFILDFEEQFCIWLEKLIFPLTLLHWFSVVYVYKYSEFPFRKTVMLACLSFMTCLTLAEYGWSPVRMLLLFFFSILGLCVKPYRIYKNNLVHMREVLRLPRPCAYYNSLTTTQKLMVATAFGGCIRILNKLRANRKTFKSQYDNTFVTEKCAPQEDRPFWSDRNQRDYDFPVDLTPIAKTTSAEQLNEIVSKRQMMLYVTNPQSNKISFCNVVPVSGNILLIPNHMVPDKNSEATIKKFNTFETKLILSPDACQKIEGTDLALWYCPEAGTHKDMTNLYPGDIPKNKKFAMDLHYFSASGLECKRNILGVRTRSTSHLGGTFESVEYSYPGETFRGLCMATLVAHTRKGSFIAGFHVAGLGSEGAAAFVTRNMLLGAVKKFKQRPDILISHSAEVFSDVISGVKIGPIGPVHYKSACADLPSDSKALVIGSHSEPRSSWVSAVVPTMISSTVASVMGIPVKHGPPPNMSHPRHQRVDVLKKVDIAYKFDQSLIKKSVVDYVVGVRKALPKMEILNLRPLSTDEAFSGIDGVHGVNSMEFSTSAGFPYKGTKRNYITESEREVEGITCVYEVRPIISKEIAHMEEKLAQGKRLNTVFRAALKDEPTKLTKDKVRVFGACNMPLTFLVRKYFLMFSALMQKHREVFECAVGINVESPEWTKLVNHIVKFGKDRIIAGDYASFDSCMSSRFMLAAFNVIISICSDSDHYTERDVTIMRGLATEICSPTYDHFGTLIQFFGSNPSGHPLTVVINSIVNSLYMRYVYFAIAQRKLWWSPPPYNTVVSLMTYGDDNAMSVAKGYGWYNHTAIAEEFAKCGIKYTMADKEAKSKPYVGMAELSFLKHIPVWDKELKLYRAVIEEDSIAKMLHSHVKSNFMSEEMHSAEAIRNVASKYFQFGEKIYEKRVSQLYEVARVNGIAGFVGDLKSYSRRVDEFCAKYSHEI